MNLFCRVAGTDLGPQPELDEGKFSILVLESDSVEAFAPVYEAQSGYENTEITPGRLCTPCYPHCSWRDKNKYWGHSCLKALSVQKL